MRIFRTYDYAMLAIFFLLMAAVFILPGFYIVIYATMTVAALMWMVLNRRDEAEGVRTDLDGALTDVDGERTDKKMAVGATIAVVISAYLLAILIQIIGFTLIQTLTGASSEDISNVDEVRSIIERNPLFIWVVVCCAPIIEEVVFRGILFRRLSIAGWYWPALIGSSFLFAVAHMQWISVPVFFFLGCLLALVYQRTRRLSAAIAVHFLINGVGVFLQFFLR